MLGKVLKRQALNDISTKIVDQFGLLSEQTSNVIQGNLTQLRQRYSSETALKSDISSKLYGLPVTKYKLAAKSFGVRVEDQRKVDIVHDMIEQSHYVVQRIILNQPLQCVSVDLGVKHLAWCYMVTSPIDFTTKIYACENRSIEGTTKLSRSWLEYYAKGSMAIAAEVESQVCQVRAKHKLPYEQLQYVLEQQMSTYNPKCATIEGQLHVLWYPNAMSVSPKNVSVFYGTSRQAFLQHQSGLQSESMFGGYKFKKDVTVNTVQRMFDQQNVQTTPEVLEYWNAEHKKDDMADAVLNALYFQCRQRQMAAYIIQLIL